MRGARRMPVASIRQIKPGRGGEAFSKKSGQGIPEDICCSVVRRLSYLW
jgi:hypothetical protein